MSDLKVTFSPDLISCLLKVLYEFIPDKVHHAFNITASEQLDTNQIFNDLSAHVPSDTLIVEALNSAITYLKGKSPGRYSLDFKASWICGECRDILHVDSKFFYDMPNISSISEESFQIPFKMEERHCPQSDKWLKFDSPPKLYYVNFSEIFKNNSQKEGVIRNSEIKCNTRYNGILTYYVYTLIFAKMENEFYTFKRSVMFCQNGLKEHGDLSSFSGLVLIGAFYKLEMGQDAKPDVHGLFANIDNSIDSNENIDSVLSINELTTKDIEENASFPEENKEFGEPIVILDNGRDTEANDYIRKSFKLNHEETFSFFSVSHKSRVGNLKSCKYCNSCGNYNPKELSKCYKCSMILVNSDN